MDEAKLMNSFYSKSNLSHVEAGDVLSEDLIFDEHGHQVTSRQELHQHVQERAVLERCVELNQPRTVCIRENVTLGTYVRQLIFFVLYHLSTLAHNHPPTK